ncbi:hypothetical protein MTO96_045430 [Rhipicephalus appendiculatus]
MSISSAEALLPFVGHQGFETIRTTWVDHLSRRVTSSVDQLQKDERNRGTFTGHGERPTDNMDKPAILFLQILPWIFGASMSISSAEALLPFVGHQGFETIRTTLGIVYARATCYRSQKKSGRPYTVSLALKSDSGAVADTTCECPAGAGGACSHILAALRLLVLLKQKGFKEAPPELSCTELPQQWRRPRRQGIRPMAVQNVDWRSPREGGMGMPMPVRLFGCTG